MKNCLLVLLGLLTFPTFGQNEIWIKPNKGQWHDNVEYLINIPSSQMYLEKDGFTYAFTNWADFVNHKHDNEGNHADEPVTSHVVRTTIDTGELLIYPNPTIGVLNFYTTATDLVSINILDNSGKTMKSIIPTEPNCTIDLSAFSSGIYYVQLIFPNGSVIQKIMKM